MSDGDKNKVATKELKSSAKQKQNKNQKHTQARREETPEMTQRGKTVVDRVADRWTQTKTEQHGRWSNMERTDVD